MSKDFLIRAFIASSNVLTMKSVIFATLSFAAAAFAPAFVRTKSRGTALLATITKEFEVGNKKVKVFDGDYADAIVETVVETAKSAIESKGSFSLAIPGGSVVTALGGMSPDAFDTTKMHIYFCNERIGANKCYKGAMEAFAENCGVPAENVHKVPEGEPTEVAAKYEEMIRADASLDQSGPIPACDLMLLGTGDVSSE